VISILVVSYFAARDTLLITAPVIAFSEIGVLGVVGGILPGSGRRAARNPGRVATGLFRLFLLVLFAFGHAFS
jgi:hypothetical protein